MVSYPKAERCHHNCCLPRVRHPLKKRDFEHLRYAPRRYGCFPQWQPPINGWRLCLFSVPPRTGGKIPTTWRKHHDTDNGSNSQVESSPCTAPKLQHPTDECHRIIHQPKKYRKVKTQLNGALAPLTAVCNGVGFPRISFI